MSRLGVGLASRCRATGVGALLVVGACDAPEATDFYERLSSTQAGSGSVGGASAGSAGDPGTVGGSGGGSGTGGAAGSLASGGTSGSDGGADAGGHGGTATEGGSSGTAGSGATGGSDETAGAGGENAGGNDGTEPTDCGATGTTGVAFDGHCYSLQETPRTWPDARQDCEQRGAHLVTITSRDRTREQFQAENAFVWQLANDAPSWLAATDGKQPLEPGDGTYFNWINGEPMTFDNWSNGNPNNTAAACQDERPCSCDQATCYEHCGFQWTTPGKDDSLPGWNDRLCEHLLPYVCEWERE